MDSAGGAIEAWSTVYTSLPCNLQTLSNSWQVRYAQKGIDADHTCYFNSNPTILVGDRLVYGSKILYVVGMRDQINLNFILAVDAKEQVGVS
jgi:hypothetical protein